MLGVYLLPVHLAPVIRVLFLLLAFKLTHAQVRAHDLDPLQLPPDHGCVATAHIIVLKLHALLAQFGEGLEHAKILDILIDAVLEGLVPDISGSDAVTQCQCFEGQPIMDL